MIKNRCFNALGWLICNKLVVDFKYECLNMCFSFLEQESCFVINIRQMT